MIEQTGIDIGNFPIDLPLPTHRVLAALGESVHAHGPAPRPTDVAVADPVASSARASDLPAADYI